MPHLDSSAEHDLLIGLGTGFLRDPDGAYWIEGQTLSGLIAWQAHFPRVLAFAILNAGPPPGGWVKIGEADLAARGISLLPLPDTYDHKIRRTQRPDVEKILLSAIKRCRYRVFNFGGWLGDPGEIAASVARKNGLAHAIWLDRVESQVVLVEADNRPLSRIKARIKSLIISFHERRAIRNADLSLLHGKVVYDQFHRLAKQAANCHDIHYSEKDRIPGEAVPAKVEGCASGPLRIHYCGRAAPMKGPIVWLETLEKLIGRDVAFHATWVGDGPELDRMRNFLAGKDKLQSHVTLTGFVADADAVRRYYRDAQLFMFCHLSDESPRNLIESLHAATPLIGFGDAYSRELMDGQDAGVLVPRGDTEALANAIAGLDRDRARLAGLISSAAGSVSHLTREAVFADRSGIIKKLL